MRDAKTIPSFLVMLSLSFAVSILGCAPRNPAIESSPPPSFKAPVGPTLPRPQADDAKLTKTVEKLNEFSLALWADFSKTGSDNLVLSPFGSFLLLELLYEGSTGPAHDSLTAILGRDESGLPEVSRLMWDLNDLPSLHLAQKIFVDTRAQITSAYLERVNPVLGESVQSVPFASAPAKAGQILNEWAARQTGGLLNDSIPGLSSDTVCVMVSALHFQGQWQHEFFEGETKAAEFTLTDGAGMKVPMMQLEEAHLNHFQMEGAEGVVLPYRDDTEMVLFLPDRDRDLGQVWAHLDPQVGLGEYPPPNQLVSVELPRFEFRLPVFNLSESWSNLGLDKILNQPDLSPMLALDPPAPLLLDVYHQTYIKVDEVGTRAAAVTSVAMASPAAANTPGKIHFIEIRFDRPFGFFLRHSRTGAILLMGRVERPEEWQE